MIEVKSFCGQISIGKQGENLARKVYFEEPSTWEETFGEGTCALLHQRNGDSSPYPIILEIEDGKMCWKITASDTAMVGDGKCELRYVVDDVIVKSKIWTTTVLPTLGDNVAEAPEPEKAWVDEVLNAADEVKSATTHQPIIAEDGNWLVWNAETKGYIDSGISAKGEPGADYVLTEKDKEEIAGKVNVPKVINADNYGEVSKEEFPNAVPNVTLWAKDASGSAYGGGGVVLCDGLKYMPDIDTDKVSAIGQDDRGYIFANLKPAFDHAEKYTDNKIANILKGYASGEVIALDDISPVSKKISVSFDTKNLLPYPYFKTTHTTNGITFTDNGDGSITANGTATATINFLFTDRNTFTLPDGTYSFSLTPQVANSYYLVTGGSGGSTLPTYNGNRVVKDFEGGLVGYFCLQIKQGVALDNVTFYPQIEKGSKATGYTPYLDDVNSAGVRVYGKNLFGGTFEVGGIAGASGNNYSNTKQMRSDFISIIPSNYYLSTLGNEYVVSAVFFYDENKVMTKAITTNVTNRAFIPTDMGDGARYMRYRIARADGAEITAEDLVKVKSAFQFEVGARVTKYEPYIEPIHYPWQILMEEDYKMDGIYPNTTLIVDTVGATMNVEYSRDLNKAFEELTQAIISLGGNI